MYDKRVKTKRRFKNIPINFSEKKHVIKFLRIYDHDTQKKTFMYINVKFQTLGIKRISQNFKDKNNC